MSIQVSGSSELISAYTYRIQEELPVGTGWGRFWCHVRNTDIMCLKERDSQVLLSQIFEALQEEKSDIQEASKEFKRILGVFAGTDVSLQGRVYQTPSRCAVRHVLRAMSREALRQKPKHLKQESQKKAYRKHVEAALLSVGKI